MPTKEQIKELRLAHNLSQSKCAAMLDVTRLTWINWEQGKHAMRKGDWAYFRTWVRGLVR